MVGEYSHRLNTLEDQVDDLEGGRCRCGEVAVEEPSRVGSPGLSAVGGDRLSPTLLASEEEVGEMDLEAWADEWAVEQALFGEDAVQEETALREAYEEAGGRGGGGTFGGGGCDCPSYSVGSGS